MSCKSKLIINSLLIICLFQIQPITSTIGDHMGCLATPGCIAKSNNKACSSNILYSHEVNSLGTFDCCCSVSYNVPFSNKKRIII